MKAPKLNYSKGPKENGISPHKNGIACLSHRNEGNLACYFRKKEQETHPHTFSIIENLPIVTLISP